MNSGHEHRRRGGSLTVMDMRAICRRLRASHGDLGLVVVDYLELMSTAKKGGNRQVECQSCPEGSRSWPETSTSPVIVLCQLNRSLEYRADKRPMLADLHESGALEQDSDVVCFIYRDGTWRYGAPDKVFGPTAPLNRSSSP